MGLNNFDTWEGWDDYWGPDPCELYDAEEESGGLEMCSRCGERPWSVVVDDNDPSVGYRGEGYLCDVCLGEVQRR